MWAFWLEMLIILDLNGVLLYRAQRGKMYDVPHNCVIAGRKTYIRPHALSFIKGLLKNHDVAIWSTADLKNIYAMIDAIGISKSSFVFIWSGSDCIRKNSLDEKGKPLFTKPLSWVWWYFENYNEFNTILIDDSLLKTDMNPPSCIYIPPSYANPNDPDDALSNNGEFNLNLKKMTEQKEIINEHMCQDKRT